MNDKVTRTVLSNGLTVLLKEMHHAPVASFWIWYKVGSRNELPGITGISHWVEHMLFKGTPTFPKGEIDRQIAREGGALNGMTWLDFTTYFETLPAHSFDLALRIEADRMVGSLLEPQEVEAERTVIISEREGNENQPGFRLSEEVQAAAFRVHPYHNEVIGNMCDLHSMTREELWSHYRTYYVPDNAIATAAGDFDSDALLQQLDELFGDIPPGPTRPQIRAVEPPQRGERRVVIEGEGRTAYIQIAFRAPTARDSDFFPLLILTTVLGGARSMSIFGGNPPNRSSRLYRALVETELAVGVGCGFAATLDPYLINFSATARSGRSLAELEAALLDEVERVIQEPISEEEFGKALKQSRAQFAYSLDSVTNQAFWLGFSEILCSYEWLEGYLDSLARVTIEQVQEIAARYLAPNKRTVGWYAPTDL
jgi:zinc protease